MNEIDKYVHIDNKTHINATKLYEEFKVIYCYDIEFAIFEQILKNILVRLAYRFGVNYFETDFNKIKIYNTINDSYQQYLRRKVNVIYW